MRNSLQTATYYKLKNWARELQGPRTEEEAELASVHPSCAFTEDGRGPQAMEYNSNDASTLARSNPIQKT